MSVKRYTYRYSSKDGELHKCEEPNGMYVLHSDYAALLARHNALVEAVKKERELDALCGAEFEDESEWKAAFLYYDAARAEVDRLLGGE